MKTLIIYISAYHGNTEKIAKAMAKVLDAKLVKPNEVDINALSKFDLIGFGSGIYYLRHHRSLLNLVDKLPVLKDKKAFIFSTSGMREMRFFHEFNKPLRKKLLEKGFKVVGDFSCRGSDMFGLFKLIGGINKGKPDEKDLENTRKFAKGLIKL